MAIASHGTDRTRALRLTMRTGSVVFGLSAILLLISPRTFASLLGLLTLPATGSTESAAVEAVSAWSLRMIGLVLVPLAVAMSIVSRHGRRADVRLMAFMLMLGSAGLAVLTVLTPGEPTLFRWAYVGVGATFAIAYLLGLSRR